MHEKIAVTVAAGIVGAILGSFFNVCIHRIPRGETLWGRSRCPSCGNVIRWYHNVPVLSYLWLKGRCTYCGWKIPVRYLVVESLSAVASAIVFGYFSLREAIWLWPLVMGGILAGAMDVEHRLIHDAVPLTFFLWGVTSVWLGISPLSGVIQPIAGAVLCFAAVYLLRIVSGGMMGGGDVVLAGGIGGFLGTIHGLQALALSFPLAVVCLLPATFVVGGKRWLKMRVPFAPFLCASAALVAVLVLRGVL